MRTFDRKARSPRTKSLQKPAPAVGKGAVSSHERKSSAASTAQGFDLSRVPVTTNTASAPPHVDSVAAKSTLADWLPQAHGAIAERASVHTASPLADREGANAVTIGSDVHLSSQLPHRESREQERVLAHELVHVAQHFSAGPSAPPSMLENEADRLAPRALAGQLVQPQWRAAASLPLADKREQTPKDKLDVERAKQRRAYLLRLQATMEGKEVKLTSEREGMKDKRLRLDDSMQETMDDLNLMAQLGQISTKPPTVDDYRKQEEKMLAGMNRTPMTVEVKPDVVRIRARFQVRFEGLTDKQAQGEFPTLEKNFKKGVSDTWNQTLKGDVFGGRKFEMVPELTLVSATAKRDPNFWLITVRPTDKGPMVHAGKTLGTAPGGIPTSVTNPLVDDGVMSIPPSHIKLPDTLGHETLHVFGMVDRYMNFAQLPSTGKPGDLALRETHGRNDPLGSQGGKILEEDLGFVFEQFGVYDKEKSTFASSAAGMTHSQILAELKRVDEIIALGRDPNSMVPDKKDFNKEMVKQTEDLD